MSATRRTVITGIASSAAAPVAPANASTDGSHPGIEGPWQVVLIRCDPPPSCRGAYLEGGGEIAVTTERKAEELVEILYRRGTALAQQEPRRGRAIEGRNRVALRMIHARGGMDGVGIACEMLRQCREIAHEALRRRDRRMTRRLAIAAVIAVGHPLPLPDPVTPLWQCWQTGAATRNVGIAEPAARGALDPEPVEVPAPEDGSARV